MRACDRYPEACWPWDDGGTCWHDQPHYRETLEYRRDKAYDDWDALWSSLPFPVRWAASLVGFFRRVVHW